MGPRVDMDGQPKESFGSCRPKRVKTDRHREAGGPSLAGAGPSSWAELMEVAVAAQAPHGVRNAPEHQEERRHVLRHEQRHRSPEGSAPNAK